MNARPHTNPPAYRTTPQSPARFVRGFGWQVGSCACELIDMEDT